MGQRWVLGNRDPFLGASPPGPVPLLRDDCPFSRWEGSRQHQNRWAACRSSSACWPPIRPRSPT